MDGPEEIAVIELVQIEVVRGCCLPEAKRIDCCSRKADHRSIIGYAAQRGGVVIR